MDKKCTKRKIDKGQRQSTKRLTGYREKWTKRQIVEKINKQRDKLLKR